MRKTTQTGLLSRRAMLAASAAIMLTALPAKAQDAVKVGHEWPVFGRAVAARAERARRR